MNNKTIYSNNAKTIEKETDVSNISNLDDKGNYKNYVPHKLSNITQYYSNNINTSNISQIDRSKFLLNQKSMNTSKNTALNNSKVSGTTNFVNLLPSPKNISHIHSGSNINSKTVKNYLDRRHVQSKERVEKIRKEKLMKEQSELSFRPELSKGSKKIVEKMVKDVS